MKSSNGKIIPLRSGHSPRLQTRRNIDASLAHLNHPFRIPPSQPVQKSRLIGASQPPPVDPICTPRTTGPATAGMSANLDWLGERGEGKVALLPFVRLGEEFDNSESDSDQIPRSIEPNKRGSESFRSSHRLKLFFPFLFFPVEVLQPLRGNTMDQDIYVVSQNDDNKESGEGNHHD
ncbi:hypothetical protein BO70DRAFT_133606 [Aspergillus heteromorphus CBS 117.55]|uniref:Uncharacterized protein n=1 Tax=Aspergillus heteromorphus CBS 117.55 TaxID=1448321 RepID=A0A317WUG8_9EURO|nr:uncharacterized protein BO70DRAFT_133606 [Aspergillus heteromorphus CBS 117.55]PWY90064.1 hypothetical protein BO70DRAFT_133606 [Aspergillus heteromorphus CBS 117.55]